MAKQTALNRDNAHLASRHGRLSLQRTLGILPLGCAALMVGSGQLKAAENQALGRYLSVECAACHQLSGKSSNGIPSIVGWPEEQFRAVLSAYARKERDGQVMQAIAARLSRTEIAALAAYFAAVSPKP